MVRPFALEIISKCWMWEGGRQLKKGNFQITKEFTLVISLEECGKR